MPDSKEVTLSKYRLEKATELLADAEALFKNGSYKSSNNRAYYSIFHAMRAVLALRGVEFKKHSGNIQFFLKEYVKTKIFSVECSSIILSASRIRTASDYDDFYLASKEEATEQIDNAIRFLKETTDYLNRQY